MDLFGFWKENKILLTCYFILAFFQPIKVMIVSLLVGKIFHRMGEGRSPRSLIFVLMGFVILSELAWFAGHYLEDVAASKLSIANNRYLYNVISTLRNAAIPSIISLIGIMFSMLMFDIDIALLFMACMVSCITLYYFYRKKELLLPMVILFIIISFNHVSQIKSQDVTMRAVSILMLDYVILNNTVSLINIFPQENINVLGEKHERKSS